MKAGTVLILCLVVVVVGVFVVFVPVVPQSIVLAPRCNSISCPLYMVQQRALVSLSYFAFRFGAVLTVPGLAYSFHWTQWRYQ